MILSNIITVTLIMHASLMVLLPYNGAVKTAFDIQVNGKRGPESPKMTWRQLTERDCIERKLSAMDSHHRDTWRSGVRSVVPAASQLPGKGPTDVDTDPVPAC